MVTMPNDARTRFQAQPSISLRCPGTSARHLAIHVLGTRTLHLTMEMEPGLNPVHSTVRYV
jgi:hypothetical protein